MCDNSQNGIIETAELKEMLTSLIAIAKTDKIHQDDVATLLSSMFHSAGLEEKKKLGHDDFLRLTKEMQSDFLSVGLDFKGARQNFLDTTTIMSRCVVINGLWL